MQTQPAGAVRSQQAPVSILTPGIVPAALVAARTVVPMSIMSRESVSWRSADPVQRKHALMSTVTHDAERQSRHKGYELDAWTRKEQLAQSPNHSQCWPASSKHA